MLVAISSFSSSFTIPEEEEVGEGKKLRDNNQFEDPKERYGHRSSSDSNLIFFFTPSAIGAFVVLMVLMVAKTFQDLRKWPSRSK